MALILQVCEREVAILLRTDDGAHLKLVSPVTLAVGPNTFPVTAPSLAGDVVKCGRGRMENAFAQTKPLGVLRGGAPGGHEGRPDTEARRRPAPDAGPDVTPQGLATLIAIGSGVCPYLQTLRLGLA